MNFDDIPDEPGIYCILNGSNGKRYVGQSSRSVRERLKSHLQTLRRGQHRNGHLQRAFCLDGETSFLLQTLVSGSEVGDLDRLERYFIKYYRSSEDYAGYNFEEGGVANRSMSDGTKRKISASHKKFRNTDAGRAVSLECSRRMTGVPLSDEAKAKIAKAHTGRKASAETRLKMSLSAKGRIKSAETCRRISEEKKQFYGTERGREFSRSVSQKLTGRVFSDQTKKKMSASAKERCERKRSEWH